MKTGVQLEQFIRENREVFDDQVPGKQVWFRVDRVLGKKPPFRLITGLRGYKWKLAALILLILGMTGGIRLVRIRESAGSVLPAPWSAMQHYYNRQITRKIALIRSQTGHKSTFSAEDLVQSELRDPAYIRLERAFQENPGDEQVQAAVHQYYQTRLEILDRINHTVRKSIQGTNKG
ncbi:MAG TPA: hypothetical protein VNE41_10960 [Chitinophagaceae bacterium]|nr:hypothetical protein [Chitinophagaceae bacterium]